MKTSLIHLPEIQQKEIAEILQIIKEEAKPEKVILFSAYARSNWIADDYLKEVHIGIFAYYWCFFSYYNKCTACNKYLFERCHITATK